jgi:hypothetical protein
MNTGRKAIRILGFVPLWFGILLAMALAIGGIWADIEAAFYGFPVLGNVSLPGFRCPVLMTAAETGSVTLTLKNPTDRPIPFYAHADISTPGVARELRTQVLVAPGAKERVVWTVTSADVDLGFFIFVMGATYPAYPYPYRRSTCGILVLPVPGLTGSQVYTLALAVSVLSMLGGMGLWMVGNKPLEGRRRSATAAMAFLAAVVLAALVVSILGTWMVGVLLLALAVLTITAILFLVLAN